MGRFRPFLHQADLEVTLTTNHQPHHTMTITEQLKKEREATAELTSELREISLWLTINGASTGDWLLDLATRTTAALDKHKKRIG